MRALIAFAFALALASPAFAQHDDVPETLVDALEEGYDIVAVVGQGASNQDHVVYLEKDDHVVICAFRFALTDDGIDTERSRTLGLCTEFK